MSNDKAKAEILDWCSQRVECLARRKVLDLVGTLDAAQSSPETASVRDAFEAWATSDNRAIQPLQFEERTDANNHYYESDHDNNAFIGWKAAGHAPRSAVAATETQIRSVIVNLVMDDFDWTPMDLARAMLENFDISSKPLVSDTSTLGNSK